jgi:hypothetical protein
LEEKECKQEKECWKSWSVGRGGSEEVKECWKKNSFGREGVLEERSSFGREGVLEEKECDE